MRINRIFLMTNNEPDRVRDDVEALIKRCDDLYDAGYISDAYDCIVEAKDNHHPEIQWRIARGDFKLAEKNGEPSELKRAIAEGVERLRTNLRVAPRCANSHKWIAIMLASKEEHDTFKQKLEEALIIKEHLLKAMEYNPRDYNTRFALGKWCYHVSRVSWVQKKMACTMFPNPPNSSYEEALTHFREAERLNPDIFSNCFLMQAICLLELGDKAHASVYLNKCVALKDRDDNSRWIAKLARELAKKNDIELQ